MRLLPLVFMFALGALGALGCGGDDAPAPDAIAGSDDATLSALAVVELPDALFPAFDPLLTAYTAPAELALGSVRVTATANDPGATVMIGGEVLAPGEASIPFALALGDTWIDVLVTAANGDTRNYCVTIARAADLAPTYVKAPVARLGDNFGFAVALDGDTLVVTASGEDSAAVGVGGDMQSQGAPQSGAAYVYVRAGDGWALQAYLKASNTETNDLFGWTVAIDGDTIAVGALGEDSDGLDQANNNADESGAVYVFTRTGTTWSQQAYLKAPAPSGIAMFGHALALSGDTLVVGEPSDDTDVGAVHVFVRSGSEWSYQARLGAAVPDFQDLFGYEVALDGDTLVASAVGEDSAAGGVDGDATDDSALYAGAAYVFTRSGTSWSQQAYLKASAPAADDAFGWRVAVEGDTVVVSAAREAARTGAAYVFARTGTTWAPQARLRASNPAEGDEFGSALALSGDLLLVGAIAEDSGATGVNGTQADESVEDAGAGYLFSRLGDTWPVAGYLKASNPGEGDVLGFAAAVSRDALIFGAISEDSSGVPPDEASLNAGALYVFE